jgi:KUP system potassium uptake protein
VFSITRQCLQVDLLPRMRIVQSSAESAGQVYVPFVNWTLCVLTIALAIGFGSSDALAGAYGVGVSITMLIDSVLMIVLLVATHRRGWRWAVAALGAIVLLEALFVAGNLQKLAAGGWFPLAFGLLVFWLLNTWREGRESMRRLTQREDCPLQEFRQLVDRLQPTVIGGTAVFLSSNPDDLPRTLVRNLRANRVLHTLTIVMTVDVAPVPHVLVGSRCRITELMPGLVRVQSRVGFMDPIDVPQMMREVQKVYREIVPPEVRYVIGRDDITTTGRSRMSVLQKAVFAFMSRNAEFAGSHLGIPANMILESGAQVEL